MEISNIYHDNNKFDGYSIFFTLMILLNRNEYSSNIINSMTVESIEINRFAENNHKTLYHFDNINLYESMF